MKIDVNDPRLTAYAFGELPHEEAEAVRKAIKGKPELKKYVDELAQLSDLLSAGFGSNNSLKLHPDQRNAIHQAGKKPEPENIVSLRQSAWKRPLGVILAAAAAVTVCFVVLNNTKVDKQPHDLAHEETVEDIPVSDLISRVSAHDGEWKDGEYSAAEEGASGVVSHGEAMTVAKGMELQAKDLRTEIEKRAGNRTEHKSEDDLNQEKANDWVLVSHQSSTRVPLFSGNSSWKWITQALEAGLSPAAQDVRVEELINHFNYIQPKDFVIGGIDAGAELLRCPWDKDKLLALVHIRNNSDQEPMVEVGLTFGYQINAYKLLGYNQPSEDKVNMAPAVMKIQSGYGQMVLYEVDPGVELEEGHKALMVHINASQIEDSDHRSFGVEYAEREWKSASPDVRLAILMATWARCLENDQQADKDLALEILGTLKKETLEDDVTKSLEVVEQSLGK